MGNRLPFLVLEVVGPMGKRGALLSSWTISCVIFRNKFRERHATLTEREKGPFPLATGVAQHLVAPRPQALQLSGHEGGHMIHQKGVLRAAVPGAEEDAK